MSDSEALLQIEINGRSVAARAGQMLIEVADQNDIYIPRFCYHKALSVAANCRMCLVEVTGAPKPLPACATPVAANMKIATRSTVATEAQRAVMEFLLINHPLDCPICDQGGECELQDLAMGYGKGVSRYQEKKRAVPDQDIGPLVQTDMTRCIHCTRCTRFGEEIAGLRELGVLGRGEHMQIGTYVARAMRSPLSGNVIDLCPVGALTSKPFRYAARAWEMRQKTTIAPHDGVGSNVEVHIKENRILRVVPAENAATNEMWLSDRDRFSYLGLYHPTRLLQPKMRCGSDWQEIPWEIALDFCAKNLLRIKGNYEGEALAALVSPSATSEERYLVQKIMQSLGCSNVDHRLRQRDFRGDTLSLRSSGLECSLIELEGLESVLVVGGDPGRESPLINYRLRKAALRGAKMFAIDAFSRSIGFDYTVARLVSPAAFVAELAAITVAVAEALQKESLLKKSLLSDQLLNTRIESSHRIIAEAFTKGSAPGLILFGELAISHPDFSLLQEISALLATLTKSTVGYLRHGANSEGAEQVGMLAQFDNNSTAPSEETLNAHSMFANPRAAYLLMNVEPEVDCWHGAEAEAALNQADFVVAFTAYETNAMQRYATLMLPIALFAENEGSFVNAAGNTQSFTAAVSAPDEARPSWRILRVLGERLKLDGFDFSSLSTVQEELQDLMQPKSTSLVDKAQTTSTPLYTAPRNGALECIAALSPYAVDPLARRSLPLCHHPDAPELISGKMQELRINQNTANKNGYCAGAHVRVTDWKDAEYVIALDNTLADNCAFIPINAVSTARPMLTQVILEPL